jgi:DNA-binding transcriptional LysR family regulator
MELRHVRYFIAAAEEEHFGRAAERLQVTRPAVSHIITDLERELETPLFERFSQHVKLTAAGRVLLPRFVQVMDDLGEALVFTKRVGQGKTGRLDIGYGSLTLMHSIFRAAVKQFHEIYPEVTLSLCEMSSALQPNALAEGKIQAGFMHFGPNQGLFGKQRTEGNPAWDETALDFVHIQTGSIGVAMPLEHRFANREFVTLEDLADERFVLMAPSSCSPSYNELCALCKRAGFEPRIIQEVTTIASQVSLISAGMGVGLAITGNGFSYPDDVSIVPLKDFSYPSSFIFGWFKDQRGPTVDRMIEIVENLVKRGTRRRAV